MTKQIRLSADTKVFHEPHPTHEPSPSRCQKLARRADCPAVTSTPQSSCGLCPPGYSLKKWPRGVELFTRRGCANLGGPIKPRPNSGFNEVQLEHDADHTDNLDLFGQASLLSS